MRVIFAGSPEPAVPVLRALVASHHEVVLVVTREDRPRGRSKTPVPTPVGVVAQIQGHKPSATAEKHYTVRPLELLRLHHEKIEAWMLEQAGVTFDAKAAPSSLRVVKN